MKDCKKGKHRRRDNKFGVTWCVDCGRVFDKPSGKGLFRKTKAERLGWERIEVYDKIIMKIPRTGIIPSRSEMENFFTGSKITDEERKVLIAKHGWLKKLVE